MNQSNPKSVFTPKEPIYIDEYKKIKKRCGFQKKFSGFLLIVFFTLQYSVPIFLVVLGSIASSREQIRTFFASEPTKQLNSERNTGDNSKLTSTSDLMVSRIIYLVGLITILLGVVNNIIRPAESYDVTASFNNKFAKFEQKLDLEFIEMGLLDKTDNENVSARNIIWFLITKNDELCQLIDEYNSARSLSPGQTSKKECHKDNVEAVDYLSTIKSNDNKVNQVGLLTNSNTNTESGSKS